MTDVELRRLELRDLNAIEEIERSSYPTPWSRSMFASELAKPSSLCLGAFEPGTGKLIGYLIISRYVDAWHVMNVAVAPGRRRQGIASMLLNRLFELTAGHSRRGYTLEVRVSNAGAIKLYEELGFRAARRAARLLHRQPRGRADHVEGPGLRAGGALLILGLETSCDETAAALLEGGEIVSNVVASQADLHARFGGVVPEVASRRHLELVVPVIEEALGDRSLDEVDTVAVTQGPGLIGALLVGLSAAKALAWGRGLPLVPVDHLHGHVASLYLEPDPLEPPFLCLLASGGHTLLVDVPEHGAFRPLGTTLDDAAGEAFDKGARLLGLGYPGGAEIDRLAREGDPEAFGFPVARVPGLDFSFSGVKTALLYEVRGLGDELEARRADLAASYQRAIVRALVARTLEAAERTGAERVAVVGGVAANSELRASLPDATAPPLPLCTDNAAMIASAARYGEAIQPPGYLALDAFASAL